MPLRDNNGIKQMSHFLCGELEFRQPLLDNEQVDFAFKLDEWAIKNRLGLQLGFNIVQPVVFDILGKKDRRSTNSEFVFLLTDSPISNTSDALVHPNFIDPMEVKNTLNANMQKVQRFLSSAAETGLLAGLSLYVSRGYDTSYAREEISLGFLPERSVSMFNMLHGIGIPSTEFVIRF